jgi:hypothetical protein
MTHASIVLGLALILCACTETPQTATTRKADDKPWDNASAAYSATGYKPGDRAAWEEQIKNRNQGQNEYARAAVH